MPPRVRRTPRVVQGFVRFACMLLVAVQAVACVDDGLLVQPARLDGPFAPLALSLVGAAGGAAEAFDAADQLQVLVIGFDDAGLSSVLVNETVGLTQSGGDVVVNVHVPFDPARDSVQVVVTLLFQGNPLFTGSAAGTLTEGHSLPVEIAPVPVVHAVAVSTPTATIEAVGDTFRVTGAALFATGDTIFGAPLAWTSLDETIATVDASGLVTGVARGAATIQASAEGIVSPPTAVTVASVSQGPRSIAGGARSHCSLDPTGRVHCVGSDDHGDLGYTGEYGSSSPVAAEAPALRQLSMAGNIVCGIDAQRQAWCWGWGPNGELGNGTTDTLSLPVAVLGGHAFVDIDVGVTSVCALDDGGAAWCWGANNNSQLGTTAPEMCGTMPCSTMPVRVDGGRTFTDISVGLGHACALAADGVAYCWGWNAFAQLGDGGTANAGAPVMVNTPERFVSIEAGAVSTCGITAAGAAWCWGSNHGGVLGNGAGSPTSATSMAAEVVGGHVFRNITISNENTVFTVACGLTESGAAYCWGVSRVGAIGSAGASSTCTFSPTNSQPCTATPTLVDGGHQFVALGAGAEFVCGMTVNDEEYCWGDNRFAQLGDGTLVSRATPMPVLAPAGNPELGTLSASPTSVNFVAPGDTVGVVVTILDTRGNVIPTPRWFWTHDTTVVHLAYTRSDTAFLLAKGPGTTTVDLGLRGATTPIVANVAPPPAPTQLVPIAVQYGATCALDTAGQAWCWGSNAPARMGIGSSDLSLHTAPEPVVQNGVTFVTIEAGGNHACGLTAGGELYCWGANWARQTANSSTTTCNPDWDPTITTPCVLQAQRAATAHRFVSLASTQDHMCGITAVGSTVCWGSNPELQTGTGLTANVVTSPTMVQTSVAFESLVASPVHTCGLTASGAAWCWGSNSNGQIGNGSIGGIVATPQAVTGGIAFVDLAANGQGGGGAAHMCGLDAAGQAYCWGVNDVGQLGINDPATAQTGTPTVVQQGTLVFTEIAAGWNWTCAIATDQLPYCWGSSPSGTFLTPTQVGTTQLRDLDGMGHACGVTPAGAAYCWGGNGKGELGDGTTNNSGTPVPVTGGITFQ